ncbi:MAG: hypothetical protein ACE5FU_02310, partial [Nitrospinota bacterium]
ALNRQLQESGKKPPAEIQETSKTEVHPVAELTRNRFLRAESVKTAEGLLFSLEMYKNALANPVIKPGRLSDLLTDLNRKSSSALQNGQKLPEDDPLRKILLEIRAVIANESSRFFSPENVSGT